MGAFQPWHIVVVFLIALFVFGPRTVAQATRGIRKTMREVKDLTDPLKTELDDLRNAADVSRDLRQITDVSRPAPRPTPRLSCGQCGHAVQAAWAICPYCGAPREGFATGAAGGQPSA